jgi:hypothetical protein
MPPVNLRRFGLLLFAAAWVVAITYSVTAGGTSPERLPDGIARIVEANCKTAQTALAQLPALDRRATPAETATRLDQENEILTRMAIRQRQLRPEQDSPAEALRAWIADWQRLIAARERYAGDLRTKGADARFIQPAYNGVEPIADTMNDWILEQGKRTNTCNTDALQGEVVNGPRKYETPD